MARHKGTTSKRVHDSKITTVKGVVSTPALPPPPQRGLLRVRLPACARHGTLPTIYSPSESAATDSAESFIYTRAGTGKRVRINVPEKNEQVTCSTTEPIPPESYPDWMKLGCNYTGFSPFNSSVSSYEIPRISYDSLSPKSFFEKFVSQRRPCVLELNEENDEFLSMITNWKNIDYLRQVAGEFKVAIEIKEEHQFFGEGRRKIMSFSEFSNKIESGNENLYLSAQPSPESESGKIFNIKILIGPTTLGPDFILKSMLLKSFPHNPSIIGNLIPYQYNLWMGRSIQESSTGLHHDFHDNLYVLLKGIKYFRIFPPNLSEIIGLSKQPKIIYSNGLISYDNYHRSDGADEAAVLNWRIEQAGEEVEALRQRLGIIKNQIIELNKQLLSIDSNKKRKKKNHKSRNFIFDLMQPLTKEIIISELNTRQESSDLVSAYIDAALLRQKNFTEQLDDLILKRQLSEISDNLEKDNESNIVNSETTKMMFDDFINADDAVSTMQSSDDDELLWNDMMDSSCPPGEKPDNFCKENTPDPHKHINQNNYNDITPENVLTKYIEIKLKPKDLLYLPASWFHEVISTNSNDDESNPSKEEGHIAFNYWFSPPSTQNFDDPYIDDFWARRYKKMAANIEQDWQLQCVMNMMSNNNITTDDEELNSTDLSLLLETGIINKVNNKKKKKIAKFEEEMQDDDLKNSGPRLIIDAYNKHKQLRNRGTSF